MQADEELVRAAVKGEQAAFVSLVERYRERLFRFLLTRCASRADAEDALQDTFINAYRYLNSYDPRWRFSTWIYRIGIREARRTAMPEVLPDVEIADPAADPLNACIAQSSRQNLWVTAKRILSDEAYVAMWLRYVEDMSVRDVADAMDRSVSWAKVTLMRSRDRLAEVLADEPGELRKGGVYGQA